MLPRTWLNRIFSFNNFRCQFLSLWITAWRQAPLEIWNLGTILYLPLSPSIPTKTHSASMCHKWTQQVHLFFSFFWSGLLFNETIVPSSGERRKKRLPKMVKHILKIESGKTWTAFHLLKGYLNDWVKRTITTGDLRRDLKKKR